MKLFRYENIIYLISVVLLSFIIYAEYEIKEKMYEDEKIEDLQTQYKTITFVNENIIDTLLYELLEDKEVTSLIYKANKGIDKDKNRQMLFDSYTSSYKKFQKKGVLQLHFHLANGESFLRFHKPSKFGDSLLFRKSIKKIIETKKKVTGFEVGRFFDGYRYIYPLFYKGDFVGSVEASIKTTYILKQMNEMMNGNYNLVLKSKFLEGVIHKSHIDKYYHKFYADVHYYVGSTLNDDGIKESETHSLENIKKELNKSMDKGKPFFKHVHNKEKVEVFSFIPIYGIAGENLGYFFSFKEDSTPEQIEFMQMTKYIVALILFSILLYLYKQGNIKTATIEQLNKAIDQTTLVSKTDTKGKITYVNDAFEKLSGYTKEELMGKPHNIVRDPSMPKSAFKDMWKTIQNKEMWHGTITNRKKDGSTYTVSANVMPILDINGSIKEYIAIRHDVTELEHYKEILKEQLDDKSKSLEENINYTKQYEEAINSSTAVLKTDAENIITYANERFCKLSGYRKDELIGLNCKALRHENHIQMGDCDRMIDRLKNKEVISIVFTNVAKDNSLYFLDTLVYPIINIKGEVNEHLHLMHDISEIINLHQELEDTQKEIIYKMGEIGETRSKETGNHVKRVAEYSKLLATLYGLGEKDVEILRMASPMHDIGKVGIPDAVLKKPGKLDVDEWKIMQSHAELGYEMLKHSNRPILKAAAIVASEHHEKWDGSGYPKSLKGDDIHIYGRITAIADVFDALGSDRVYKKAWELDKILDLFKEQKGKHFDPDLVDLFFENLDSFLEIRDKFKD